MARKIFVTIASGGHGTDIHYRDTILNKRSVDEIRNFISPVEANKLNIYTHGRPYAVWGAVPGPGNDRTWQTMEEGDYLIVYREKKIIAVAEVAFKTRNPKLAEYYWGKNADGKTWELVFFMTNFAQVNVEQRKLNQYLSYKTDFTFRGFAAVEQKKTDYLLSTYGDLLSILNKLEKEKELEKIDIGNNYFNLQIDEELKERIKRAETPHDEMQWRLISLGNKAKLDVWVPPSDQGKTYDGHEFRPFVIKTFREAIDIPSSIKNIDTVWKLGLSIKAAFEIENSTAVYSGILRLSDLKAEAPNSNYPLYIVADREKRAKVFRELNRPTFANDYLQLDKSVKYLSYDSIRKMDSDTSTNAIYDVSFIDSFAESANIEMLKDLNV
jgi:hypothetical protein